MRIIGTNDEITYIMLQCQKKTSTFCEGCVLKTFCEPQMFKRLNPRQLDIIETGKFEAILIPKGDKSNVSDVQ